MKKEFRSFNDARKFVHSLKLKNQKEWELYRKSKNKPDDIPTGPADTYKNKGWTNLGDWLGTGTIASQKRKFRTFVNARKFVQSLQLKNDREWREFYMSDARPLNIPTAPNVVYKSEWISLGDWLGTGTISPREISKKYWSFEKSRDFIRLLELKNKSEWEQYCKSGIKSEHIPTAPWSIYKNKGWISLDDFLGHGRVSNFSKKFLTFEESRSFVRKLGLSGENEWREYCKSGKKPDNIPYHPERSYKNKGWISFGDFFGTGTISPLEISKKYWSFEKSKQFIHSLRLKNDYEWRNFSKSSKRPEGIPTNPKKVYAVEWSGLGNWLGTGTIAYQNREWMPWKKAKLEYRKLIEKYKINNLDEWRKFLKTHKLPQDLPSRPDVVYTEERARNIMK